MQDVRQKTAKRPSNDINVAKRDQIC